MLCYKLNNSKLLNHTLSKILFLTASQPLGTRCSPYWPSCLRNVSWGHTRIMDSKHSTYMLFQKYCLEGFSLAPLQISSIIISMSHFAKVKQLLSIAGNHKPDRLKSYKVFCLFYWFLVVTMVWIFWSSIFLFFLKPCFNFRLERKSRSYGTI